MNKVTLSELLNNTKVEFDAIQVQYQALCKAMSRAIKRGAEQAFTQYPEVLSDYFESKALPVNHPIREVVTVENGHFSNLSNPVKIALADVKKDGRADIAVYEAFYEWCVLRQAAKCDIDYLPCKASLSIKVADTQIVQFKNPDEVGLSYNVDFHEQSGSGSRVEIKNEQGTFVPVSIEVPLIDRQIKQPMFYKLLSELYRNPKFFDKQFSNESDTAPAGYYKSNNPGQNHKLDFVKALLLSQVNNTFLKGELIDENSHNAIAEFYKDINSIRIEKLAVDVSAEVVNKQVDKDSILNRIHALNTFMDKVCDDNYYHHNSFTFLNHHMSLLSNPDNLMFLDKIEEIFGRSALNHGTYGTLLKVFEDERREMRMALKVAGEIDQVLNEMISIPCDPDNNDTKTRENTNHSMHNTL